MTVELPGVVGIVGCDGVAAGWAARFLAQGLAVVAVVADGDEEARLRQGIDEAWPILAKLGLLPGASRDKLRVVNNMAGLGEVAFVQCGDGVGNGGETAVPAHITLAVPAYSPPYQHPERVVVVQAHEPVYLSPLVEVWGEDETAVAAAADFYRQLSMQPIVVDKTSEVSIVARLQTAVRQEAEKLRQEGVSEADVEAVLQLGVGLDWMIGGVSGATETAVRDEALLAVMHTLRGFEIGAGQMIAAHDARRYTSVVRRRWQVGEVVEAPLRLYRCDVDANWIDYNGHMTESSYLAAFGDASDALFRYIGIDEAYRAAGNSYYTVETHINYYLECGSGDRLLFTTQVLGFDAKRLHFFHEMYNEATGELVATTEQMLLHVDMVAARAAVVKEFVLEVLTAVYASHKQLPIPKQVGRRMKIKSN